MSVYLSRRFWARAAERAVKTAAQTAAALVGTSQVGITDLAWADIASVAAVAAALSLLTSVGSAQLSPEDDPSLVG